MKADTCESTAQEAASDSDEAAEHDVAENELGSLFGSAPMTEVTRHAETLGAAAARSDASECDAKSQPGDAKSGVEAAGSGSAHDVQVGQADDTKHDDADDDGRGSHTHIVVDARQIPDLNIVLLDGTWKQARHLIKDLPPEAVCVQIAPRGGRYRSNCMIMSSTGCSLLLCACVSRAACSLR